MNKTKICFACKKPFRVEELVAYSSSKGTILHNYCPTCLKEKQARDNFSDTVCRIFGLKAPGPQIWTERKRLRDKYGYTDDVIVQCLDYLYTVLKKKKLAESLCLVTPITVNEALKYRDANARKITNGMTMETKEYFVPIQENQDERKKDDFDLDDWLDD